MSVSVCAGVWFSYHCHLLYPLIPSPLLSSLLLPCWLPQGDRYFHVMSGRLWCWSVLMERALSLFVHLKPWHVTSAPGRTVSDKHIQIHSDTFTLNTSILLIIELLAALVSTDVLFTECATFYSNINKSYQFLEMLVWLLEKEMWDDFHDDWQPLLAFRLHLDEPVERFLEFIWSYCDRGGPVTMPPVEHAPWLLGQGDVALAEWPSSPCHILFT